MDLVLSDNLREQVAGKRQRSFASSDIVWFTLECRLDRIEPGPVEGEMDENAVDEVEEIYRPQNGLADRAFRMLRRFSKCG